MGRRPARSLDNEFSILRDPRVFATLLTRLAWGWTAIDPWQDQVLTSHDRFLILNCSRQSGKSSILMVKALWTALTVPKALILIVAEQRQSNEDIRKVKELLAAYREYLDKRYQGHAVVDLVEDNKTSVEVDNGARIIALPANEKVRGYSAPTMIIIDEAAYLSDEVFVGLDPMLEVSQGQLIVASTPNGTTGFYHREWTNPRYTKFRVPWQMCPRIKAENIAAKRLQYSDAFVDQEYGCVFLDDLSALFSERALLASLDDTEDVFDLPMRKVNEVLQGNVELI